MLTFVTVTCRHLKAFATCESGSSTIEAVVWVPLITYLMTMVADFSFVFYGKANALQLVQDSNRALSVGQVSTTAEVEDLVRKGMGAGAENIVVQTQVDRGIIRTELLVPASVFATVRAVPGLSQIKVAITSQQFLEQ